MRERLKGSLALQMWGYLACILVSLAAAIFITDVYVKSTTQKSILEANDKILQQVESRLETYYETIRRILQVLSYSPTTTDYYAQDERGRVAASDSLATVLANMMLLHDDITGVYLYDMAGNRIAALGTTRGDLPAIPALNRELRFGGIATTTADGTCYFTVCNPVFDLNSQTYGQQIGMAVLLLKTDGLRDLLMDDQITEHTELFLTDGSGQVLAAQSSSKIERLTPEMQESDRFFLVESRTVRMDGWQVVSRLPKNELHDISGTGRNLTFLAYLIGFLMIGILARFCYQNIILRIHKVDQFIKSLSVNKNVW